VLLLSRKAESLKVAGVSSTGIAAIMSRKAHLKKAGRWNVLISLLAFVFFVWQVAGKYADTPGPVIVAGFGGFFGLVSGWKGWRIGHLSPPVGCEDVKAHFTELLVGISRVRSATSQGRRPARCHARAFLLTAPRRGPRLCVLQARFMALFATVVWLAELLYQVGTGMAPDGSITEARATNRLNNGVVALMFVVVTTMVLGYGNVSSHITSCKAQRVPCSCVLYTDPWCVVQLRLAHNISNVASKLYLQLERLAAVDDNQP